MLGKQTYILAISGGVDSVALLHKLTDRPNPDVIYIVAHFDHGIRDDSHADAELVQKLASDKGLTFELGQGKLGPEASEASAREARYRFLRAVAVKYKAERIVTAHHLDDVLETIVMNILRGTGPRGLFPMSGRSDILRPLINRTKQDLLDYAQMHELEWREDSTNDDEKYKRNYVRKNIMPKLASVREELLQMRSDTEKIYDDIDQRIHVLLPGKNVVYRPSFVALAYSVQREFVRGWLARNNVPDIDAALVNRLCIACKTLPHGKQVDIKDGLVLRSEKQNLLLTSS